MCSTKNIEILAPAGNFESLRQAVNAGADAIYLGASAFSARSKADNFSPDELLSAVEYCHLFGVKTYLAVNTLMKPEEYNQAIEVVKNAKMANIDAIIVQDIAFISKILSTVPDITIHLSTQAGVHNAASARVAERLGVRRVILSRETMLEDIREIKKSTSLEIESFVQGALCVSFSGNCYLSSIATGNSGNRGRCLQFCRKKYRTNGKSGYFLSPKDLMTSEQIFDLIEAGVTSFKIEGRMRRPEYVGAAVKYYRDLLDRGSADSTELTRLYNRGDYTRGYFYQPNADVIYPSVQGHIGEKIGSIKSVSRDGIVDVAPEHLFRKGDCVKFLRNGMEVGSGVARFDGKKLHSSGKLRCGDDVRLTTDVELIKKINQRDRKISINVVLSGSVGGVLQANVSAGDINVSCESDFILEKAKNSPTLPCHFVDCFSKIGDFPFVPSVIVNGLTDVFVPRGELNEFRRKVYCLLKNEILRCYNDKKLVLGKCGLNECVLSLGNITDGVEDSIDRTLVRVDSFDSLRGCFGKYDCVVYSPRIYDDDTIVAIKNFKLRSGVEVFLELPCIARGVDCEILERIALCEEVDGVLVQNLYGIELAREKKIILGSMFNVLNPNFVINAPNYKGKIMSIEYDGYEFCDNYAYVFGFPTVMTFAHCPKKTLNHGNCLGGSNGCVKTDIKFNDELGNVFTVRTQKIKNCYAQMLNCVPIDVRNRCDKMKIRKKFIDLVGLSPKQCYNILCGGAFEGAVTSGYFGKKLK